MSSENWILFSVIIIGELEQPGPRRWNIVRTLLSSSAQNEYMNACEVITDLNF